MTGAKADSKSGYHAQFKGFLGSLASEISWAVRKKMFSVFMQEFSQANSILDVGATSEGAAKEANYFEELYPDKSKITACGIEDASFLEKKYPGTKFVQIRPGEKLPFSDQQFDAVFSNAVIEHVVGAEDRKFFLKELCRVGKGVFITTPNKFYPIEFHTGVALIHWFDSLFNWLMLKGFLGQFYNPSNLRLLSKSDLLEIRKQYPEFDVQISCARLLGLPSNYLLIMKRKKL